MQMSKPCSVIAIGASAGGLPEIAALLRGISRGVPAVVLVALHRPANKVSYLAEVLQRESSIPVSVAAAGEALQDGHCYIGTPSMHLSVDAALRAELIPSLPNRTIDTLFHSVARHAGQRAVGVVLSGLLDDGSEGLAAIKQAGGIAMVQSPESAAFDAMPRNAARGSKVDLIASTDVLAQAIRLVTHSRLPHRITGLTDRDEAYPHSAESDAVDWRLYDW
jgi:chemotaxis response regulator CheB